jgi:hypothetical protein
LSTLRRRTKLGVTRAAVRIPPVADYSSHVLEIGGEKRREVFDLQRRFTYIRPDSYTRVERVWGRRPQSKGRVGREEQRCVFWRP